MSLVRMNGDIILYKKGFKPQKDFTISVPTCTGWMNREKEKKKCINDFKKGKKR